MGEVYYDGLTEPCRRPGLVLPVKVDPHGRVGPSAKGARGPAWRRSSRGWWVPARVEISPEQRILEAAVRLSSYGGVTGWAGLRWLGARWFEGIGPTGLARPVTLNTSSRDLRSVPGIRVSAERLDPGHLTVVDGVAITWPVRSTWFEMRHAVSVEAAAVVLAMAAYDDLVSVAEMAAWEFEHPAWTGAPQCRAAVAVAHENCWSPMEAVTAYVYEVAAELPRPLCNRPLFDRRGKHIGTPDLLDPEAGLVVEYDGATHLRVAGRATDVRREERYRAHGLEYLTVLAPHLGDRNLLVDRMVQARNRSRFEAESQRTWTVITPPWWVRTHTVAMRRALCEEVRADPLGYRSA